MAHKLGRWLLFAAAAALVVLLLWPKSSSHPTTATAPAAMPAPERMPDPVPAASPSGPQANGDAHQALEFPPPMPVENARIRGPQLSYPSFLPEEGVRTLQLILTDGPFPYRQDGSVFQNRERRLPAQPRGYYREYTVPTPGSRDRGARRIVAGGQPPAEFFYTDDHYRNFRRFTLDGSDGRGMRQ